MIFVWIATSPKNVILLFNAIQTLFIQMMVTIEKFILESTSPESLVSYFWFSKDTVASRRLYRHGGLLWSLFAAGVPRYLPSNDDVVCHVIECRFTAVHHSVRFNQIPQAHMHVDPAKYVNALNNEVQKRRLMLLNKGTGGWSLKITNMEHSIELLQGAA